ncbi:MAG TPA: ATP-binding protein [Arachidicoccus sp.]
MKIDIAHIIKYETESTKVDFKKEEYHLGKNAKKNELLKDISAFANYISDEDKFIIIGVEDIDGTDKKIFSIDNPTDEAKYQQFVHENIEPKINFEYKPCQYEDKLIRYFRIFGNTNRPYLFKKEVINPVSNKPEYNYGDGVIRIGTFCYVFTVFKLI